MGHWTTKEIAYSAIGSALIVICSWLSVPAAVPFTLQTFAVCFVAALLGGKGGMGSVGIYLCLGMTGLPVFSGFRGGLGVLLGTTGGYIIGFLFTALITGACADRFGRKLSVMLLSMTAGVLICYVCGTAWFLYVYAKNSGAIGVMTALSWCVFPYLIPDGIKIAAAAVLTGRLYPVIMRGSI